MSTLPPISEIASQTKRRKTSYAAFQSTFVEATSLDLAALQYHLDQLTERQKEWLLVSKFGLSCVNEVCRMLSRIPESVTSSQRTDLLSCLALNPEDLKTMSDFILDHCPHLVNKDNAQSDLKILAPPTNVCYNCDRRLVSNHKTQVKCYTLDGFVEGTKFTLRCKQCSLTYNYAQFGNKNEDGFRFYPQPRMFIEASDTVFFSREMLELQCSLANHSWVSFQGFAESYNDTFCVPADKELSPRIVSELFYNGEVENELRKIGKIDHRFKKDSSREECMTMIEEQRRMKLYPHNADMCTSECKKRGCGHLWVTDGIWKVVFPHCMFRVVQSVQGIPALNLPDVCTMSPERGKAFCWQHCELLQSNAPDVPLGLKDFLKFCGVHTDDDSVATAGDTDKVDRVVKSITVQCNNVGESASTSQGTSTLIERHPELVQKAVYGDESEAVCRKDTGQGKRLRKWSRGHQFVVRGGGHIDTWQPLYRSESPSQVYFILIQWLLSLVKENGGKKQHVTLAYDNMCNLAKLKVAQNPLPFPPPLDKLWLDVQKVIDVFHFKNHISPDCQRKFSPTRLKEEHPDFNTQAGE